MIYNKEQGFWVNTASREATSTYVVSEIHTHESYMKYC